MHSFPLSSPNTRFGQRQIPLSGQRARILVVDDTRANAEALAASLAIDGFATRFALGGVDALQQLNPWKPHIFVLDITMPEHNGFAVARVLRRISSSRHAGIIAFTALGKDEFAAFGPPADFDGYCQKGGSHTPLLTMIRGMIR
jgi:two-component system OmpR family response regulator